MIPKIAATMVRSRLSRYIRFFSSGVCSTFPLAEMWYSPTGSALTCSGFPVEGSVFVFLLTIHSFSGNSSKMTSICFALASIFAKKLQFGPEQIKFYFELAFNLLIFIFKPVDDKMINETKSGSII